MWKWTGERENYNAISVILAILTLVIVALGLLQVFEINVSLTTLKTPLKIEGDKAGVEIITDGATTTFRAYQK